MRQSGCVAQLAEQRSPKSPVGGSNPSALEKEKIMHEIETELKVSKIEKLKEFFNGLESEIKQITWPSKKELKKYTKLVIYSTIACGFCVYIVDLTSKFFLDGLRNLVKLFLT